MNHHPKKVTKNCQGLNILANWPIVLLAWFKREGFGSTNSDRFQNHLSTWSFLQPRNTRDLCAEVWCFGGQCERGSPVEEFEYTLWNFMSCIWWEPGGGRAESTPVEYLQTLARGLYKIFFLQNHHCCAIFFCAWNLGRWKWREVFSSKAGAFLKWNIQPHGEADDLHKSYVARPVGNLVLKGRKSPTKVG